MTAETSETGRIIAQGKTKTLWLRTPPNRPALVEVMNHDDITAGDGARKDSFPKKGEYSVQTNHYVMELLRRHRLPIAYVERCTPTKFRALYCSMLPYEVVAVRRVTEKSSIRKRHPEYAVGHRFDTPEVAFFLKTSEKKFKHIELEKDDPYIVSRGKGGVVVRRPDMPLADDMQRLVHVPAEILFGDCPMHPFEHMSLLTRIVFEHLERAWAAQGCTLCDLKIEFGTMLGGNLYTAEGGDLRIADVIDNDSWRLLSRYGVHLDKQPFRDESASLEVIAERYREVAERVVAFEKL